MPLRPISSFACYYGSDRVDDLASYDLVILPPPHYGRDQIERLQQAGGVCFAYLSLGELPEQQARSEWQFIDPASGQPANNPLWKTIYLDCRLAAWQNHVLNVSIPAIMQRGFAGLFLDTIDVQEIFPETRKGAADLVRQIRAQYPSILLAANRGFSLLEETNFCLDAFLFEAFTTHCRDGEYAAWNGSELLWTEQKATELRAISGDRPILALDYAAPEDSELRRLATERAGSHGFVSFVGTRYLNWLPVRAALDK